MIRIKIIDIALNKSKPILKMKNLFLFAFKMIQPFIFLENNKSVPSHLFIVHLLLNELQLEILNEWLIIINI